MGCEQLSTEWWLDGGPGYCLEHGGGLVIPLAYGDDDAFGNVINVGGGWIGRGVVGRDARAVRCIWRSLGVVDGEIEGVVGCAGVFYGC